MHLTGFLLFGFHLVFCNVMVSLILIRIVEIFNDSFSVSGVLLFSKFVIDFIISLQRFLILTLYFPWALLILHHQIVFLGNLSSYLFFLMQIERIMCFFHKLYLQNFILQPQIFCFFYLCIYQLFNSLYLLSFLFLCCLCSSIRSTSFFCFRAILISSSSFLLLVQYWLFYPKFPFFVNLI